MSTKVWFIGIVLILAFLSSSVLNFQEKHYHENNEVPEEHKSSTLGVLQFLHTPDEKSHTDFFRFFGCGTHNMAVVIFLLYFHLIKKNV